MEVWFYHLQTQPLERALPKIVEKAVERGWRVAVQTVDDLRLKALDDLLWTYAPESFLAHSTSREPHPDRQRVLVTTGADVSNAAQVWICVDGAQLEIEPQSPYERVILMFDGHNEVEVTMARQRWSALKAKDVSLAYWQQDDQGRWDRRM